MGCKKTGLTAQSTRMTVIANNLANVNTIGFKKDRANFEDLLYQRIVQAGAQADQDRRDSNRVDVRHGNEGCLYRKATQTGEYDLYRELS